MMKMLLKQCLCSALLAGLVSTAFAQSLKRAPDERFYPLVFKHVLKTQQPTAVTTTAPNMDFFSRTIGLTETENAALLQEAQAWQADVAPVDKTAFAMIASIRARTPGGHLAPGQQPPVPPPELLAMQTQRDTLTLKHVQHLHAMLGDQRFAQFDKTIRNATQGHAAPNTTTTTQ